MRQRTTIFILFDSMSDASRTNKQLVHRDNYELFMLRTFKCPGGGVVCVW